MRVLVIVPSYNEEKNIINVSNNLVKLKENADIDFIFINDGSSDNSRDIFLDNGINHIELIDNLGIGGAVQTGYKYAYYKNYDIAVQFDGDGQHDAGCIEDIINPICMDEADMVIGSRFIEKRSEFQSTFMRRVGIVIISFVIKLFVGKKIFDTTSGFRAVNKKVIEEFAYCYPVDYPEPETTAKLLKEGYRVKEIPVIMHKRVEGATSITWGKSAFYMFRVCLSIMVNGIGGKGK